ncbi:MAG: hypothetical protein ABIG63_00120 [Chloroflexota bacterium]
MSLSVAIGGLSRSIPLRDESAWSMAGTYICSWRIRDPPATGF